MTLTFSTSSALASVAVTDRGNSVLWSGTEEAPRRASGACLSMLRTCLNDLGIDLETFDLFVADMGPGSFTGVRVGVTLAKSFGYLHGRPVAGVTAFDLIDPHGTVVLPSRRGEFFVRRIGEAPFRSASLPPGPFRGFGPGLEQQTYPEARKLAEIGLELVPVPAAEFLPHYLIEPSISIPKLPFTLPASVG